VARFSDLSVRNRKTAPFSTFTFLPVSERVELPLASALEVEVMTISPLAFAVAASKMQGVRIQCGFSRAIRTGQTAYPQARIEANVSESMRSTGLALSMEKLCDRSGNEVAGKTTKVDAE
jgi:hypothetical protein